MGILLSQKHSLVFRAVGHKAWSGPTFRTASSKRFGSDSTYHVHLDPGGVSCSQPINANFLNDPLILAGTGSSVWSDWSFKSGRSYEDSTARP